MLATEASAVDATAESRQRKATIWDDEGAHNLRQLGDSEEAAVSEKAIVDSAAVGGLREAEAATVTAEPTATALPAKPPRRKLVRGGNKHETPVLAEFVDAQEALLVLDTFLAQQSSVSKLPSEKSRRTSAADHAATSPTGASGGAQHAEQAAAITGLSPKKDKPVPHRPAPPPPPPPASAKPIQRRRVTPILLGESRDGSAAPSARSSVSDEGTPPKKPMRPSLSQQPSSSVAAAANGPLPVLEEVRCRAGNRACIFKRILFVYPVHRMKNATCCITAGVRAPTAKHARDSTNCS